VTASPLEKPLILTVYFYSRYFNNSNSTINRNLFKNTIKIKNILQKNTRTARQAYDTRVFIF